MSYLKGHSTRVTGQSEPIPGSAQVENSAGGFVWEIDKWARLRRFLILGSEGGSYYASERGLTWENVSCLRACMGENPERMVAEIVTISVEARAPKNIQAIYALALVLCEASLEGRRAAAAAVPSVCRIGTDILQLAAFVDELKGWSRLRRSAVASWFEDQPEARLAYQAVKYPSRYGWSMRDLLRLSHPKADSKERSAIYDYICGNDYTGDETVIKGKVRAHAQQLDGESKHDHILVYKLPREALPTEWLNDKDVWAALLWEMPMTALIRNLATMTRVGLLGLGSPYNEEVVNRLLDREYLRKSRVHPIQVLIAQKTYASGKGLRGTGGWVPVPQIVDALNEAFYLSFGNVERTGKRFLLALDVSSSMTYGEVAGVPGLTPREAAAAMTLVTAKVEPSYITVGFHSGGGWEHTRNNWRGRRALTPLAITPSQRLDDVLELTRKLEFGGTDCALPMLFAREHRLMVDTFIVYTDNETWAGSVHPAQALVEYRKKMGIDAKLIVCGMVSNGFSIADPDDRGMLDVVGFDTATPQLISDFAQGRI